MARGSPRRRVDPALLRVPDVILLLAITELIAGLSLMGVAGLHVHRSLAERFVLLHPSWPLLPATAALIGLLAIVAAVGLFRVKPYGRTLQLLLAWTVFLIVPVGPFATLWLLEYFTRPAIKLIFSSKAPHELTDTDVEQLEALGTGRKAMVVAALSICGIGASIGAYLILPPMIVRDFNMPDRYRLSAINAVRAVMNAEEDFKQLTGVYGDRPCLQNPADCLPGGFHGVPFLQERGFETNVYSLELILGDSHVVHSKLLGQPISGFRTFAVIATPVDPPTGRRRFCGDSSPRLCAMEVGTQLTADGLCPKACQPIEFGNPLRPPD